MLQLQSIPALLAGQCRKLLGLLRIIDVSPSRPPRKVNDNPSRFSSLPQQHAWSLGGYCSRCGRDRFSRTGLRDTELCTGEGAADHVRNALQLLQFARFVPVNAERVDAVIDHASYVAALERLIQAIALLERRASPPSRPSSGAAALYDEMAELERAPRPRIPSIGVRPLAPPAWPLALVRLLFGSSLLTTADRPAAGTLSLD